MVKIVALGSRRTQTHFFPASLFCFTCFELPYCALTWAWFYPSPAAANRPFWIATVGLSRLVELGAFWVQRRSDPIPGCLRPSKSCHGLRQPLRSLFNGQQPVFFTYLAIPMIVFEAPISPSRSAGSPQSLAR